ncbi:cupredoxin domain-containing protein [Streptomyces caniscabiei]|uniref:cupredoxin domain-containing protein n=1 Tax=Streptomyces caniscabiei TaxID=2746961 RepID=UPI0029AEB82D|nr:cupredoxin domain-containing protein [Streptomyces caniscabiei]MDX2776128.1 cupredoxin domain-containing protein [Streptomyces caniscabiei]
MEQQSSAPKHRSTLMRIGIVAIITVALTIIVASVFSLVNPNGIETPNDETDTVVTLTDTVDPAVVQIKAGETVTWVNDNDAGRRLVATVTDAGQALEGFGTDETFGQGESYSFTFDKPGTFTYEDAMSPETIKGTIIVE